MPQLCRYHYDPLDRLASRTPLAEAMAQRFYSTGQLATELQGAEHRSFVRSGAQLLAQTSRSDTVLLGADQQNSVLQADDTAIAYAPYGHREDEAELPGFTGEQPDPVTGHYLLGNGYRAYNPVLMRFNSPDNLSPFAGGGLNAYSYCLGDPINRVDPTGHMSWQAGLGIGLSVFGIVASVFSFGAATPLAIAGLTTGVASGAAGVAQAVTEETNPQASSVLGWVSLGLGVASAGFGLASGFQKVKKVIGRLDSMLSSGKFPGAVSRISQPSALAPGRISTPPFPIENIHLDIFAEVTKYLDKSDMAALEQASKRLQKLVFEISKVRILARVRYNEHWKNVYIMRFSVLEDVKNFGVKGIAPSHLKYVSGYIRDRYIDPKSSTAFLWPE